MLNDVEFFIGFAEGFRKTAGLYDAINHPINTAQSMVGAVGGAIRHPINTMHSIADQAGSFMGGKLINHIQNSPREESDSPGFLHGLKSGVKDNADSTKLMSKYEPEINKVVGDKTDGMASLQGGNVNLNYGNVFKHFGGQAMDFTKQHPLIAGLGALAVGGGMYGLGKSLFGGGGEENSSPQPGQSIQPQHQQPTFSFNKPGITG